MEHAFAKLVVMVVAFGVPAVMSFLWNRINIAIWKWRLGRSIGPVPPEVYVPRDVRAGWRPLGMIALLWFLVGVLFFGLAAARHFEGGALNRTAMVFCVPPLVILLLKFMWLVTQKSFGVGVASLDNERRQAAIDKLTSLIPTSNAHLLPYMRLWRAGHQAELLTHGRGPGEPPKIEKIRAVEADLEAARGSGSVDGWELEQVEKMFFLVRSEAVGERAKARSNISSKERKKVPELAAVETERLSGAGCTLRLADGTTMRLKITQEILAGEFLGQPVFSSRASLLRKGLGNPVWQFRFPFMVAGVTNWDVAFEIRNLVLTSIGDCRTFAELQECLITHTTPLLRNLSDQIEFGLSADSQPVLRGAS